MIGSATNVKQQKKTKEAYDEAEEYSDLLKRILDNLRPIQKVDAKAVELGGNQEKVDKQQKIILELENKNLNSMFEIITRLKFINIWLILNFLLIYCHFYGIEMSIAPCVLVSPRFL